MVHKQSTSKDGLVITNILKFTIEQADLHYAARGASRATWDYCFHLTRPGCEKDQILTSSQTCMFGCTRSTSDGEALQSSARPALVSVQITELELGRAKRAR
jgi:hypothetical protein